MTASKEVLALLLVALFLITSFQPASAMNDSDYDGVSDEDEIALNMDPDNPDTDGDGISDLDDPTPKGSLVNEEEVWDMDWIEVTTNLPVSTFGTEILVNVTVGEDSDATDVTLYIYISPGSGRMDLVEQKEMPLTEGRAVFQATTESPGIYFFVAATNTTGLTIGSEATTSEVNSLQKARRLSYARVSCYYEFHATIDSRLSDILTGHTAIFDLDLWEYRPVDTSHEFLSRFTGTFDPDNALGLLYRKVSGKIYLGIDDEFSGGGTRVNVPSQGTTWSHRFNKEDHHYIKVSAYPFDIKWDYNFYTHLKEDHASISVHGRDVTWLECPDSVGIGQKVTASYYAYRLSERMGPEIFDSLYYSMGMVDIVLKFPTLVDPVRQYATIGLYYYSGGDYLHLSHSMGAMVGRLDLKYRVQVPGEHVAAAGPGKVDSAFSSDKLIGELPHRGYRDDDDDDRNVYTHTESFTVNTRTRVHLHLDRSTYFPSETIDVRTDVYQGGENPTGMDVRLNVARYERDGYHSDWNWFQTKEKFTDGLLGPFTQHQYRIKVFPLINDETARIVKLFGPEKLSGPWTASLDLAVNNLAIYAFMPQKFPVSGMDTFRVLVRKEGNLPAAGVRVEVGYANDWWKDTPDVVYFSGTTDNSGMVTGTLQEDDQGRYDMVTAYGTHGHSSVPWGAGGTDRSPRVLVDTSKPVYRPGDVVDVRVTVLDPGTETVGAGSVNVSLIDPYHMVTAGNDTTLNEYGVATTQLHLPDFLAWGTYTLRVRAAGYSSDYKDIEVRHYESPDAYIEVDAAEGMVLETGDRVDLPVKIRYIQGEPVMGGTLNYTVLGQRYGYRQSYEPRYNYYDYDYRSTRATFRSYWSISPMTEFELSGHREVVDGEATLSFTIPARVAFLSIQLDYDDGYNNTASLTHVMNVGAQGELTKALRFGVDQTKISPDDEVTLTAAVDIFDGGELVGQVPDSDMNLRIRAFDNYGLEHILYDRPITTGDGEYTTTMAQLGIDIRANFDQKIFYYYVDLYVVDPELRLQLLDTATVEFMVYFQEFSAELEDETYGPGDKVSMTFRTHDHSTGEMATGKWRIEVGPPYRYYPDYINYYYSGIGNAFIIREGTIDRAEQKVHFTLPENIRNGRYDVRVTFTAGDSHKDLYLQFQVLNGPASTLDLSGCPDTFLPGEKYTVDCTVTNTTAKVAYADLRTFDGLTMKNVPLSGGSGSTQIGMPVQLSPVTMSLSVLCEDGTLLSETKVIYPDTSGLRLDIQFDRDVYAPGGEMKATVTVLDDRGEPVEDAWVSFGIVDKFVDDLESHENATGFFNSVKSALNRAWSFNRITNYGNPHYAPRSDLETSDIWYRFYQMLSTPAAPRDWYANLEQETDRDHFNLTSEDDWEDEYGIDASEGGGDGAGGASDSAKDAGGQGGDVFSTDPSLSAGAGTAIHTSVPQSAEGLTGDLASAMASTAIRAEGDDVAYFTVGAVAANGTVVFNITLPTAIATWKVEVAAHTLQLAGVYAEKEFVVKRDFYVEADIPVRICQDDEMTFTINVFNFLNRSVNADVGIVGDWFLAFEGNERSLKLGPRSIGAVSYDVKIIGALDVNMTVVATEGGGLTDALLVPVNIHPNGALRTSRDVGAIEDRGSAEVEVEFLPEALEGSLKAKLRIAAGYAGLWDVYSSLFSSQHHGTTESIASSLYRYTALWRYYEITGRLDYYTRVWLTRVINGDHENKGLLDELVDAQRSSGGWGFWDDSPDDVWLTAYILGAVGDAKNISFTRADMEDDGVSWLTSRAQQDGSFKGADWLEGEDEVLTAFVYYMLGKVSPQDIPTKTVNHLDAAFNSGALNDAYAVTTYALGRHEEGKSVSEQLTWLDAHKVGSHWEGPSSLGGADETTAWVAFLFVLYDHDKLSVRGALEWIDMHGEAGSAHGSVTGTLASMQLVLEMLIDNPYTSVTMDVAVDGIKVATFRYGETWRQYSDDKYTSIFTVDLLPYIKDGGSKVTLSVQGSGDVFYELTTIQYLRVDVDVDYTDTVEAGTSAMFDWNLTLDPGPSDNVWMEDVWIEFPYVQGLRLVSYDHRIPDATTDEHRFRFTFITDEPGDFTLEPLVVNYYLSAGERRSYLIRDYFGPVEFRITTNATADALAETQATFTKQLGGDVFTTSMPISVKLMVEVPSVLQERPVRIVDNVPDGFFVVNASGGEVNGSRLVWTRNYTGPGEELEYLIQAERGFRGTLGSAVVEVEGAVCGVSGSPGLEVTPHDFMVQRSYDTSVVHRNETLWVTLKLHALEGRLVMPVVEDYMPSGFHVVESYLPEDDDDVGKAYADPDSPDKVVFLLRTLEEGESAEFSYGMRSTIQGSFSAPCALAYPSRDVSTVVYGAPGSAVVLRTWKNETGGARGADNPSGTADTTGSAGKRTAGHQAGSRNPAAVSGTRTSGENELKVSPTLELLDDRATGKRVRGVITNDGEDDREITAVFASPGGEETRKIWAPAHSVQTVQSQTHEGTTVQMLLRDASGNELDSSRMWDFTELEEPRADLTSRIKVEDVELDGRQVIKVTAYVTNTGSKNVEPKVLFMVDGDSFYSRSLRSVPGTEEHCVAYCYVDPGEHTFVVIIDPYNSISEADKTDNIAVKEHDFQPTLALHTLLSNPYFITLVILAVASAVVFSRKKMRRWVMK